MVDGRLCALPASIFSAGNAADAKGMTVDFGGAMAKKHFVSILNTKCDTRSKTVSKQYVGRSWKQFGRRGSLCCGICDEGFAAIAPHFSKVEWPQSTGHSRLLFGVGCDDS